MTYASEYLVNYLQVTETTLKNAGIKAGFKERILKQGYDEPKLQEGLQLHREAQGVFRAHLDKRQQKLGYSAALGQRFKEIRRMFSNHRKRLRNELANDSMARADLRLDVPMGRNKPIIIEQASQFYGVALKKNSLLEKIEASGFRREILEASLEAVNDYLNKKGKYGRLKGECQSLVVTRDKKVKLLHHWMKAFIAACRLEFVDNPQELEELGIFVANSPRSGGRRK